MTSFLHGFRMKPTIRLSPDAVVYIQQDLTSPVCGRCGGRRPFNQHITSVQVNNTIDSTPGTCTIQFQIPRHEFDGYLNANGELVFQPMQEIQVYYRGRYLVDHDVRYYPAFWGLVYNVSRTQGTDTWGISLSCVDMLKWWEMTTIAVQPSILDIQVANRAYTPMQIIFANFNPYEIILSLAVMAFGDIVTPSNWSIGDGYQIILDTIRDQWLRTESDPKGSIQFSKVESIIAYWTMRFREISHRLKIFGISGYRLNVDMDQIPLGEYAEEFWEGVQQGVRSTRSRLPGLVYDLDTYSRFRADEFLGSGPSLYESQQRTKLEIAAAAAQSVGHEFFQDMNGDLIFKPPFYNMDVRDAGPIYTIQEEDIINLDLSLDANQIYTRCEVTGRFMQIIDSIGTGVGVFGYYIDWDLSRRYGVRNLTETVGYLRTARSCTAYAMSLLSKQNAKATSGSVTIIGRPEIRLGRPVYIPAEDAFFYVTGISHSYTEGGTFQTTLTLQSARRKYLPPDFIDKDQYEDFLTPSPERGVQGAKNFVMKLVSEDIDVPIVIPSPTAVSGEYRSEGDPDAIPNRARNRQGQELPSAATTKPELNDSYQAAYLDRELEIANSNRRFGTLNGNLYGDWKYVYQEGVFAATHTLIPLSDEFGFQHIGPFPFGRGMTIGELDSIKPVLMSSESEGDSNLVLGKTPPLIVEQYGLSSGVTPTQVDTALGLQRSDKGESFSEISDFQLNSAMGIVAEGSPRDIAREQGLRPNEDNRCSCPSAISELEALRLIQAASPTLGAELPSAEEAARELFGEGTDLNNLTRSQQQDLNEYLRQRILGVIGR